jgi:hypothetical protein
VAGEKQLAGETMSHSDLPMRRMKCDCVHEFQDRTLGKGVRLFNPRKADGYWRCTVCGKDKMVLRQMPKQVEAKP